MIKPKITFEDFLKLDLRIATILEAENIKESEKLVKLTLDVGEKEITVVAGISKAYSASEIKGKQILVLVNLETRKLMGIESQGMILAADSEGMPVLICPEKEVKPGSEIR